MFQGCDGRVCDAWSLQSSDCLLPRFFCCLSRLLNGHLCRGLIFVIKGTEIGGGGCVDNCLDARLVCGSCDVSRSFEPKSRLARTQGCLRHAVLCEAPEEPFERPDDLVVDLCSPLVPPGLCGREPAGCG